MAFPRRLLAQGEQLVLDLRPHWIALVFPGAVTVLILAAMSLIIAKLPGSRPSFAPLLIVLAAIGAFLALAAPRIVAWATSHFVVTSDRVIHRSGWFAKDSMEIPLENINDVRFHQGVLERLIGAGNLTLESAGEFGQETFEDVRHPERVQKVIYEMAEASDHQRSVEAHPASWTPTAATASVADELEKLDRLRRQGVISEDEFQSQKSRLLDRGSGGG